MDDADFVLDWSELLSEEPAQQATHAPARDKPVRTRAQHQRQARELESTARIRDRCASQCMGCRHGSPKGLGMGITTGICQLHTILAAQLLLAKRAAAS